MMPLHWFGNRLLSLVTNILYSTMLSDMETCYKLFDAAGARRTHGGLQPVRLRARNHGEGAAPGPPHIRGADLLRGGASTTRGRRSTGATASAPCGRSSSSGLPRTTEHLVSGHDRRRRGGPRHRAVARRLRPFPPRERGDARRGGGERGGRERRPDLAMLPGGPQASSVGFVSPAATSATAAGATAAWRPLAGDWTLHPNGSSSATRTSSCTPARAPRCARPSRAERAWALVGPRIFDRNRARSIPRCGTFPPSPMPPVTRCWRNRPAKSVHAALQPRHIRGRRGDRGGLGVGLVLPGPSQRAGGVGGSDEAYSMYLEDTDLCWRAHDAGWGVGFAGTAEVTHLQGVITART